MITIKDFNRKLNDTIEKYKDYLEKDTLVKTKEYFKIYNAGFKAIFQLFLKKALIRDDPYKHEYKISEISIPPLTPIPESDKEAELGIRMSFYNTQLEYIEARYVFNCNFLIAKRLKLLRNLLSYVDWDTLTEISENHIAKYISELLHKIRHGTDQIAISLINTSITQLGTNKKLILSNLDMVKNYHNEIYKLLVRRTVFEDSNIYSYAASNSSTETLSVVKKKFSELLVDQPFIPDLITEIITEEFSPDTEEQRNMLIKKVTPKVPESKKKIIAVKPPSINVLLNAALTTCQAAGLIREIIEKTENNFTILAEPQTSGFIKWLFKIFNSNKNSNMIFNIEYLDDLSGIKKIEKIDYTDTIQKYKKLLALLSAAKLKTDLAAFDSNEKRENYLNDFIDKQNTKLKSFTMQIQGIDKYAKETAKNKKKSTVQIKGAVVEINAIKNIIIKSQQLTSEYTAAKEEYNQFKSLGISTKSDLVL